MDDIFTPEQITQILEEFFKVVGTRRYVGERYVPIFGRKGEESIQWDNSAPYEPLTIVLYQGDSYTSRQFVPIGVDITNQEFWALTGNYNAQIEMYHNETIAAQNDIDTLLPKADFSAENTVKKYIDENPTRILTFDTVADMQDATYLLAGMTCHTNGFHAAGDGGAAYYKVGVSGDIALQGGLYATEIASSSIQHVELVAATAETSEEANGSFILKRDVLEIDTSTGGNRSGHNTGFCTNVNDYGSRQINIGVGQLQAAADFVGNSVLMKGVPYSTVFEPSQISSVTEEGIVFTTDVSSDVLTGNVLWLTQSMERKASTYQTGIRKYDDVFVYQTYAGIVTEVNENSVVVDSWRELPWTDNTSPSGTTTPTISADTKCFVNPLNGLFAHYDLITTPEGVPNGYKIYHSQAHISNSSNEAVYSNGDLIVFEDGNNGYGFAANQIASDGRLEAAFYAKGYIDYLLKGDFTDQLPEYRRAITTVGLTTGGTLQKDCMQVESPTNQSQLKQLLTRKDTVKYSAGIYRISNNQTIDVSDLLPNAEYQFIMIGNPTITINNDSSTTILPVTSNAKDTRSDIPAGGSLSITRTTNRNAHNLIRVMYVVPPRQSGIDSYPNTTLRDLIITIEALTPTDYTITTAAANI